MRTLWTGAVSFGLVNIPVKMYTATENKDIKFKYLHNKCHTPVQYKKVCPVCNVEVPAEEIIMGYEYEKDRYVVIREEDFHRLPGEGARTIDILDFVDLAEIDPIFFEKSYYLEPSRGGEKAYTLLKKAMLATGKIAVARVAIRSKESLAALRISQGVLIMETMFYPDEIRSVRELTGVWQEPSLHENEVRMAENLITNLSSQFNPAKYTNEYRARLMEMIQAKIAGNEVQTAQRPETGKVIDLMEALQASLEMTNQARAEEGKKAKRKSS
ncbi:MAG: Ku protein [Bacillota bacterium]